MLTDSTIAAFADGTTVLPVDDDKVEQAMAKLQKRMFNWTKKNGALNLTN